MLPLLVIHPGYRQAAHVAGQAASGLVRSPLSILGGAIDGTLEASKHTDLGSLESALNTVAQNTDDAIKAAANGTSGLGNFLGNVAPRKILQYVTDFFARANFGLKQQNVFGNLLKSITSFDTKPLIDTFTTIANKGAGRGAVLALAGAAIGGFIALSRWSPIRTDSATIGALEKGDPLADNMKSIPFHMTKLGLDIGMLGAGLAMFAFPVGGFLAAASMFAISKGMDLYKHFTVDPNMFNLPGSGHWLLRPFIRPWCQDSLTRLIHR